MATGTKSTTQSKAHEKVDNVAEETHNGVDNAAEMKKQSQERIEKVAHEISEQAHNIAATAKNQSEQVTSAVGSYAKENPIKTIGIAFLAGALATSLLSKRK
ncbi:hypothetical protein MUS1_12630 [Marinomonas ushuaiensis DSM 15871]|uniref:DUF883 domain-containing protein n=1 Tax=Marinomonas ushuaiensis DSM 15871 TaxID=1122207 RepID=X7E6L4_9GAMM|nr:DUF883 family protein [Marinomonas ushuaiensis]ETX10816.1 hypothetical protein MUS1_12630 [Marinomonas ushuaiensis DSM 15871]